MEIVKHICQVIGALGSLATVGAIWFLFNQNKTDRQRLKLSVEPRLRVDRTPKQVVDGFELYLENKAETAILYKAPKSTTNSIKIELLPQGDNELKSENFILELNKRESYRFNVIRTNPEKNEKYTIYVIYKDTLGNRYSCKIQGKTGDAPEEAPINNINELVDAPEEAPANQCLLYNVICRANRIPANRPSRNVPTKVREIVGRTKTKTTTELYW